MSRTRIVVVGGGIAGLAVAWAATRARAGPVVLVEREPVLAAHSTGRNAGIFRPLETTPGLVAMAERTRTLLDGLTPAGQRWLRPTGGLFVAPTPGPLADLAETARATGRPHRTLDRRDLGAMVPALADGDASCGLWVPDVGVIDVHLVVARLSAAARAAGVEFVTGREVARVRVRAAAVTGVELAGGEFVAAERVVIAGGAWAAALGADCGAPLPLRPLRRHLAHLTTPEPVAETTPVVWRLGDEVYFRPESGGLLASPCDEDPWPPGLPPVDPRAVDRLAFKLAALVPRLAGAGVRRAWACLRTVAPDRRAVSGADPRVRGLFWLAGLGGHGMSAGVAAAEVVAARLVEREHPLATLLDPARLLGPARESTDVGLHRPDIRHATR